MHKRTRMHSSVLTAVVGISALLGPSLTFAGGAGAEKRSQESESLAARLHRIYDRVWEFRLEEEPLFATAVGENRFNHRLPSVTPADFERRANFFRERLAELGVIDPERLSKAERVNYEIFERQLRGRVSDIEFRGYLMPINADSGFHIGFSRLARRMPFSTSKDYENYFARLNAFPEFVDQQVALMREGLRIGMSIPRVSLAGYEGTISPHVVDRAEDSVFHEPLKNFPRSVPESARGRLVAEGERAILEGAVAGYRQFLTFMTEEYMPNARTSIGASELPNGRAYYAYLIGQFTTMDRTADEVHELGLSEVTRIRKEMDAVIQEVNFDGDFAAFLDFLRTDPRFFVDTPEALLKEASYIAKKMDGKLPSLFKTLPRQPYTVEPVPDHMAPKYTAGRYVSSPIDSHEPGIYWVNTHMLESRTLYTLEALTFHEAVPGHHLQNALRQELSGLPNFRRYGGVGAYGEGWGLYSERLGLEAGFYEDPYSNFGRLTYEMWRACRLVVDTGMHAKGWTRDQTLEFLASNTALALHEIRTETDRYISWPGQALSYKMGELKIRELRARAEKELGPDFDIREFHDAVLLSGPVPMTVLDGIITDFIAEQKAVTSKQ